MKKIGWIASTLIAAVILITGVAVMNSSAVEPGKISRTAGMTAVYRAIGARDQDEKIRNNDTYAEQFITLDDWDGIFPYFNFRKEYRFAVDAIKTDIRFSYYFVQARTKHIDAILSDALNDKTLQVVNLGAGYDSRAYRFHQRAPMVKYYEVDLPEMVMDKKKRVAKALGALPGWVRYVPVDFNKQVLSEELMRAGYDKNAKTLFIWEGVTMYISKEAVTGTLKFIAEGSAPGSLVVFDYVSADLANHNNRNNQKSRGPAAVGEPMVFGIEDGMVEYFIAPIGLKLISNLGPLELTNKYLIRSDCQVAGYLHGFTKIAYAMVPDKIQN